MNAVVYSDGGKNGSGCYGSFMAVVDGEDNPRHEFTYEALKTGPEAEVMTAMNALMYIKDLNTRFSGISWALVLDAKFLYDHITTNKKRKVAAKFEQQISKARQIVRENDIDVRRVSGEYMKLILGH